MVSIVESMISFHGVTSTSLLILSTKPYRKAIFSKRILRKLIELVIRKPQNNLIITRVTPFHSNNRF